MICINWLWDHRGNPVKQKVFAETDNPIKQYNIGRFWKPTRKRAITKEDVQKIQSLKLPESTESYSLSFARDIFLFSYCVAGINFKDIATLRYGDIQNGRIYYQRHKTGKELNSPILPQTRDILERYSKSEASPGHSDLETTQIYLDSFENSQIDEAMKNLL